MVDVYAPPQTAESVAEDPGLLAGAEVILSGWGAPVMDAAFLKAAPGLEAVFYGAGSVRHFVTDELWERNVRVVSAYAANAAPVAEYALAAVLFSLKRVWHLAAAVRRERGFPPRVGIPGAYGSTVGIVSLGATGRLLRKRLEPFDLRVVAHDPYVTEEEAAGLGVELVPLEELFATSDVVSLHTPWLQETEGMVEGAHLASMKPDATFINTSRGAVVREAEMVSVLAERPDLQAVLDVTHPEPPEPGSPLYDLPNVVLTPHIAGSQGAERRRMGRLVVDELRRYVGGDPLQHEVTREREALMA
ncbi:glycerate dehydrogenase [Rubrobacter tropicus]|uniref:Glycerate dehydrogenase n=2 Tax=Rubrobacter tropicus TaxID=2653851 RepID=A0A6G8QER0_9ACTN|nr:glycerate dehydrogenase [Rubrobacter tropicus]